VVLNKLGTRIYRRCFLIVILRAQSGFSFGAANTGQAAGGTGFSFGASAGARTLLVSDLSNVLVSRGTRISYQLDILMVLHQSAYSWQRFARLAL
jgi:hypothetical protein